ncbi:hypothetical protein [Burkholderia multivorans]|uniref:hypothetical protein n=1 Tax=Burkholderia multivorans TaxID=87883 RepID=UPI0011B1E31B|nr:hypothetical protein [Burkholderia multivorans]MBU9403840.1 hypothetical protein [Burkholderia multivorans]MDN8051526.1 hypothetical protein [Burkholderia multivorans]
MPDTWAIGGMPIPKSLTFASESDVAQAVRAAPEKPHRNLGGFKNPNGVQYLCAAANSTVSHGCSPKNLTFLCEHRTAKVEIRSRKGSPVQETGTVKRRFFPRQAGLSGDIDQPSLPKSLTYAQFVCRSSSRKSSPLARSRDCETYPEEAHLMAVEVGEPPFRSRKPSPLRRHRRRIALLAGKTGFVSRKSSHQIAAKSRETSPFGKIA